MAYNTSPSASIFVSLIFISLFALSFLNFIELAQQDNVPNITSEINNNETISTINIRLAKISNASGTITTTFDSQKSGGGDKTSVQLIWDIFTQALPSVVSIIYQCVSLVKDVIFVYPIELLGLPTVVGNILFASLIVVIAIYFYKEFWGKNN